MAPDRALLRPRSATHFGLSLVAMCIGLGLVWLIAPGRVDLAAFVPYTPLVPCVGIVLVIGLMEFNWPQLRGQPTVARAAPVHRPRDLGRIGTRLLGFAATLALIGLAYWLLPEYSGSFYEPFWHYLQTLSPLALGVPVYFWWLDARALDSDDEYLAFGRLVLSGARQVNGTLIRRHVLGWTVKAFFLPLMTVYLGNELRSLHSAFAGVTGQTMPVYQVFYHVSYTVDLLYCVVGYTAAIRLFDSQIRSVEPTVAGWLVALMCYQPFYSVIGRFYLQYDDATFWDNWLLDWPHLRMVWAAAIVVLISIYAICTVSFGLRFSNLTNRGIITSGPYRFTKHPAYLAKNVSWWLISVPFVSEQGSGAALRNCCLLALLNGLYYLRARTEERHLSRDPTYVAYALWMNDNGWLRGVARLAPFLRYRAPGAAAPPTAGAARAASEGKRRAPRRIKG